MRWFSSDLHFGHTNVIAYCQRPFRSVGEMNSAILAAWNTTVGPDDEVWVLGDVAMGRIDESMPLAGRLVGRKQLVLGNHDRPFDGGKRAAEWTSRYLTDGGFLDLHHGIVDVVLNNGTPVSLCHFPYEGDSTDTDRLISHRPVDEGRWLLHGHVHEKWRQRGRMINVGIDAWAGRPVSEDAIVELIEAGPNDLGRLAWT